MARPNKPRLIGSERSLARRIAWEREKRGMSYEGLASRMGLEGCAIQASALYKIEKGEPPRRITVDELVALSRVFGLSSEELLEPVEAVLNREVAASIARSSDAMDRLYAAVKDVIQARVAYRELRERADAGDDNGVLADVLNEHRIRAARRLNLPEAMAEGLRRRKQDKLRAEALDRLEEAVSDLVRIEWESTHGKH
jgi:transcriptional regulator with XRE-family HTH domain